MIRPTTLLAALLLLLAAGVLACAENPNEHVQSNEFFRPSAPSAEDQASAADTEGDDGDAQSSQPEQDAESAPADEPQQAAGQEQQTAPSQEEQPADAQQDDEADDSTLQTAEDIIRRYTSPTYGYSLELICSPFCSPTSNGIDRVSFGSETGRALIGVDVYVDDDSDAEGFVRSRLDLESVEFASIEQTVTVTGDEAQRFDWEEDRRATGGFQVRWHAVLVRANDLAIVLRAGAVLDDYDSVADALERAIDSFFLPREIAARPGRYERFDFVLDYDTADFAQEFGQPTDNPPNEQAGILVLQTTTALKAVLTWQILGEAFYDGDTAITQSLRDSLGIENVSGFRDAGVVDGRAARTGETETPFGEGVMMIQSYAWYCNDSGREFVLHVLDPEDPESVALPLISSFRCSAAGDAADE